MLSLSLACASDVDRDLAEGGRGRGRGRGERGRGGRGGRGRPFDKHSQTGKTYVPPTPSPTALPPSLTHSPAPRSDSGKKVSQGWGADEGEPELKAETAAANDASAEAATEWGAAPAADSWGEPVPTSTTTDAAPTGDAAGGAEGEKDDGARRAREAAVEEEDNTLTLDQYLKQKQELNIVPKLETRKANEGDDSIWKDAVALSKKDEEAGAYFVGKVSARAVRACTCTVAD